MLKDVLNNRKLWILRNDVKKSNTLSSDLQVNIHYLDGNTIKQYSIVIPSKDPDPYTTLVRKGRAKAPLEFTSENVDYTVAFTLSGENSNSPGCSEFTQGDLQRLQDDESKLWIERKIPFQVSYTTNSEINRIAMEFFPEQDFAMIKWTVASEIERDVKSFELVAKCGESMTIIKPKDKLNKFKNHAFLVQPINTDHCPPEKDLWICKHAEKHFDLFFSHRQWADKDLVKIFHANLNGISHPADENRKIHPFWDVECLLVAKNWEKGFLSALQQTDVAVLFLSHDCLQKIKKADVYPDNVLLEWEEALQRYPSQELIIFPILVGRKKAFDSFDFLDYPDNKHCHPRSPKVLTIRKVVKEIFQIQGESVVELSGKKLEESTTKLLNTLSKVARHHETQSTEPLTRVVITSSQDHQLRDILRPLDREMRAERTRLLNAHVANTRLWLLKYLIEFLNPTGDKTDRVLWLQGNAGVGKSVMAAFAADELEKRNLLAGMFFAKHDDVGRNSARNLIRTLCFQLCEWNAEFGRMILEKSSDEVFKREALRDNANIEKMFSHLILVPLRKVEKSNTKPIVLVVDALDETGMLGFRTEILQVFSVYWQTLPSFVKLLITSRPEDDIVKAFEGLETKKLEATAAENREDALIYSRHFLRKHDFKVANLDNLANLLLEKS